MVSKKMFITAFCAVLFGSVAVSAKSYDEVDLQLLIQETAEALDRETSALEYTRSGFSSKIKDYAKVLYDAQNNAIKVIKDRLKQAYRAAKEAGDEAAVIDKKVLYRAYKARVYRFWRANKKLPIS